jgi:hypothetical protein
MSKECKAEVDRVERESSRDYRLNYRLSHACEAEVPRLCNHVCPNLPGVECGGQVLRCLQVGAGQACLHLSSCGSRQHTANLCVLPGSCLLACTGHEILVFKGIWGE